MKDDDWSVGERPGAERSEGQGAVRGRRAESLCDHPAEGIMLALTVAIYIVARTSTKRTRREMLEKLGETLVYASHAHDAMFDWHGEPVTEVKVEDIPDAKRKSAPGPSPWGMVR